MTNNDTDPSTEAIVNAWVVVSRSLVRIRTFEVQIDHALVVPSNIEDGDALLLVDERSGSPHVVSFARVYRVRRGLYETTLLLDGLLPVEPPRPLSNFGIQPPTVAVSARMADFRIRP